MNKTKYTMMYRPAGCATLPDGLFWEYVEWPQNMGFGRADIPTSNHPHGVFIAERELTQEELETFQIEKVA